MYRFLDDAICIFLDPINDNIILDFYPNYLVLMPNDLSPFLTTNFLDLNLTIHNHQIISNIYDKRTEFNFSTINLQCFTSCLAKSVFRNIVNNQSCRINRLCSHKFINDNYHSLVNSCKKYNYPIKFISKLFPNNVLITK